MHFTNLSCLALDWSIVTATATNFSVSSRFSDCGAHWHKWHIKLCWLFYQLGNLLSQPWCQLLSTSNSCIQGLFGNLFIGRLSWHGLMTILRLQVVSLLPLSFLVNMLEWHCNQGMWLLKGLCSFLRLDLYLFCNLNFNWFTQAGLSCAGTLCCYFAQAWFPPLLLLLTTVYPFCLSKTAVLSVTTLRKFLNQELAPSCFPNLFHIPFFNLRSSSFIPLCCSLAGFDSTLICSCCSRAASLFIALNWSWHDFW